MAELSAWGCLQAKLQRCSGQRGRVAMASTALVGLSQPGMQVVITPRSCCFCWQRLSAVTQKSQATSSCTLPINEGYLSYFKSSQHCYCWPSSQHLLLIWIEFTPAVNHPSKTDSCSYKQWEEVHTNCKANQLSIIVWREVPIGQGWANAHGHPLRPHFQSQSWPQRTDLPSLCQALQISHQHPPNAIKVCWQPSLYQQGQSSCGHCQGMTIYPSELSCLWTSWRSDSSTPFDADEKASLL